MSNITRSRSLRTALAVAAILATAFTGTAEAQPDKYIFQIAGHPNPSTISVRLVDQAGQPVANAELFRTWKIAGGIKSPAPMVEQRRELKPDGQGGFLVDASPGDTVKLAARVPGEDDLVRGSVDVTP